MLTEILLIVLIIWLLVLRWQKRSMIKLGNQLKNNYRTFPFIGQAYLFLGSDEDRMKMFQKIGTEAYASGGLLSIWQGSRLYINVSDPMIAEVVLKSCLEKDDVMKVSRLLTGNGSVFAPVPIWRPRRKFLAPTFSPKNLAHFVEIFSSQSAVMVEQLRTVAGKGTFSIWKYINTYAMDSVCETTLGIRMNAQRQPDQTFLKAFECILQMDAKRICQPWLHNLTLYKMTPSYKIHFEYRQQIYGLIDKVIKQKRKSMIEEKNKGESEQNAKTKTFLELLIESTGGDEGYSDLELQEETLVLVLAGTDTSAVGTAFTAVMLSRYPEIQEKLYQEIQSVLGPDRPITAEDFAQLKYLDAVVRETVRLYPPVPLIVRKVTEDVTIPSGHVLVKDCGVVINIWAVNRNPKYWGDDAVVYRPERFIDSPPKHSNSFLVFSHGPRACLGYQYAMMSMKTAVAELVRNYKLLPANPLVDRQTPLRVKFDVMMKSVDNFILKIERRDL